MDAVLTSLFCQLIAKDESLKEAIKVAIAKIDRQWWNGAWKKGMTAIGAIILALISGLAGYFIHAKS